MPMALWILVKHLHYTVFLIYLDTAMVQVGKPYTNKSTVGVQNIEAAWIAPIIAVHVQTHVSQLLWLRLEDNPIF
jgi:hypothetical protein